MLPKTQRIPRRLFETLKKPNILGSNEVFSLRGVSQLSGNARFCVSVSKKVAKQAVVRNKLRRKGYKALRDLYPNIKKPALIQISFKKIELDDMVIMKNIESLLQKIK